jgi:hypothetical protein
LMFGRHVQFIIVGQRFPPSTLPAFIGTTSLSDP